VLDPTATSTASSPAITQRINDISQYIGGAEKLFTAVAAFMTVGLGGLWIAFRKVYSQMRGIKSTVGGIEVQVEPVHHEITDRVDDTLSSRVDTISAAINAEKIARDRQHQDNSDRLDRIEDRMDHLQETIGDIRKVVDRILAKLANI
jgi:hypothetical protein